MMSGYSERQLLILSNFVYVPASISTGTLSQILDEYRTADGTFSAESVKAAGIGGGMRCEEIVTLFDEMDREISKNPSFGELSASRILEEKDVRAICYTDRKDSDPVVAFRGTGGTKEAWTDNFEGAYEADTRIQRVAGDFVRYECGGYENITVTGHSKGGNLAQYVTIKCPDVVNRCVSYDGQGFGGDFTEKYREQIIAAAPKIKSVSAYNDFVNILLSCVAGEVVYVSNAAGAENAHSSVSLLTQNEYDENGNIISIVKQGFISKGLDDATDALCSALKVLPESDKEILADVAGSTVTEAFKIPAEDASDYALGLAMGSVNDFFYKRIADNKKFSLGEGCIYAEETIITWDGVEDCVTIIRGMANRARSVRLRLEEVKNDINYTIAAKIYAEKIVIRAIQSIEDAIANSENYCNLLTEIASRYKEREKSVAGLFAAKIP